MKKLQYYLELGLEGIKINIQRMKIYLSSLLIETIANILFVSTVLIFWNVIYKNFPTARLGLTQNELYVYLAFVEIFIALKTSVAHMTGKFWRLIYSGQLLSLLIRPIHPILFFMINGIKFHMLFPPLPIVFYLLYQGRHEWEIHSLLLGFGMTVLAVIMVSLMELSFSLLSFWVTKMSALDEIIDSLLSFTKYPLTVFQYGWQVVFTIIFPFMFYATIPTFLALTNKDVTHYIIFAIIIVFGGWGTLLSILWKKGMKRYDGFTG